MASSDSFVGREFGCGFLSITNFEFFTSLWLGGTVGHTCQSCLRLDTASTETHSHGWQVLAGCCPELHVGLSTGMPYCPHSVTAGFQQCKAGAAAPLWPCIRSHMPSSPQYLSSPRSALARCERRLHKSVNLGNRCSGHLGGWLPQTPLLSTPILRPPYIWDIYTKKSWHHSLRPLYLPWQI